MRYLLALLFLFPALLHAQSNWVPGEVLVYVTKDADVQRIAQAVKVSLPVGAALKGMEPLGKGSRYHVLRFGGSELPMEQQLQRVVATVEGVEATSLNYMLKFNAEPNDAQYGTQWNMDDINVEPVWDFTTGGTMANGARIGVGICDEAIQTSHPDLEDNIWPNSPFQVGAAPHGTEVASVVGAVGNNAAGIAGVNWDVEILSSTDADDLSDVIEQFELAIALREQFNNSNGNSGLMVVSITASWGIEDPSGCDGFTVPLFTDMTNAGIILVTSGPNDPVSIESGNDFPSNCALAEHLVVTSYGPSNETPFAFGPNTVHLLAPGIEIPVATTTSTYTVVDGNSFAIPTVAGAIALLYSIPCLGFAELVMDDPVSARTLVKNAILNNTAPFPGGNALTITGGKLDVFAAYQALMAQCPVCDTITVQLNTTAGNSAQYTLVNGIGATLAQGTDDVIQFCPVDGCFNATVVDGASQPLNGTFTLASEGDVFQTGDIINGAFTFNFGEVINGCTNPNANNYNPNATCDDGSCCFNNPIAIYLIASEQFASGTAQLSVEAGGNTLFNGPVDIAYVAEADLSYGFVTVCAPNGCLQLNAQEVDVALQANGVVASTGDTFFESFFPTGQPATIPVGTSATEVCDGIDNDCDGLIDEDFIWYTDADEDGWGVETTAQVFCVPPGNGTVQSYGDCDDTDPAINPAMPDGCATADGIDNNCDGNIDEGDLLGWFPDLDADGFGDVNGGVLACTAPPDHVEAFGDCDDTNNTIFPEAPELCDGLDNDCDGSSDEDFIWYTDADGDGFGDDATAQPSCVPLPGGVQIGGDCDDTDATLQGGIILYVASEFGITSGSAHYVITQGSTTHEGDMVLADTGDDYAEGSVSVCLGTGCFSISVSPNDVPLAELAFVELTLNPGQNSAFAVIDGFIGSAIPPVAEFCDGLDNDCDGEVDEDFFWYTDADGDGVGDISTEQFSCTPLPDRVQVAGDCNDADPNLTTLGASCDDGDPNTFNDIVQPDCSCLGFVQGECPPGETADCNGNCAPVDWIGDGTCDDGSFEWEGNPIFFDCAEFGNDGGDCGTPCGAELCDGLDNDCDGEVDEDFIWYVDADGDGYGFEPSAQVFCSPPADRVQQNGDCDDDDASINPGATDVCDGVDRNCDGVTLGTNGTEVYSPNWTATASTGATVELYDLLAQGKTVVLDLFAPWCAPSISMLQNNFLQDWNAHMGPNGTDQIRIVAIAVDQSASSVTPFINSAQWPVIVQDGESFGPLYNAIGMYNNAVPTLLMICPDRSVTMLYGGPDLLPYTGIFQYEPQAALDLLNERCACRDACVTSVGCMDVNGCNYDPSATCPGPCATAQEWFVDNDGDGFGTTSLGISCTQPANSASDSGDCDDANDQLQRAFTLVILTDDPGDIGTAHYLIQQGSTTVEGDLDLPTETEGVGYLPVCIGSGCYTITITQNDVPLYPESYIEFPSDPGNFTPFTTSEGFAGGSSAEICDGIDNDCNGSVDDGFTPQYADNDGDGYGDLLQPLPCDTPGVANAEDCNDSDPNIFPGQGCGNCSPVDQANLSTNAQVASDVLIGTYLFQILQCNSTCQSEPDQNACLLACISADLGIAASCSQCVLDYFAIAFSGECVGGCEAAALEQFLVCSGLVDGDGDGYFPPYDCDDTNAAIHPNATETCDGIDNDCDGTIDDAIAYADADGDGFGDPAVLVPCSDPTAVANSDDCDDTDATAFPGSTIGSTCSDCTAADQLYIAQNIVVSSTGIGGAYPSLVVQCFLTCQSDPDPEACLSACVQNATGLSSECNQCILAYVSAILDPNCNSQCRSNAVNAYLQCSGLFDADGDSYVHPADCDDQDPAINPAAAELCDGLDNDCDGLVDEAGAFMDADGDGFGDLNAPVACGTPGSVLDNTDCDDTNATTFPGSTVGTPCSPCTPADQLYLATHQEEIDALLGEAVSACAASGQGFSFACILSFVNGSGLVSSACMPCVVDRVQCQLQNCLIPCVVQPGPGCATCTELQCQADFEACAGLVDADGDGFYSFQDCDDQNGANYPGAVEICDEQDNDCNGLVDDNVILVVLFADADGDGWGTDTDIIIVGCPIPPGYSVNPGDCDDNDPDIFPTQVDDCNTPNGIDDDCDGLVDNGVDLDGDGFGICAGDCDDANVNVYPGASEQCNGIDDDCDGQVDEDCGCSPADQTYMALNQYVGAGYAALQQLGAVSCPPDPQVSLLQCLFVLEPGLFANIPLTGTCMECYLEFWECSGADCMNACGSNNGQDQLCIDCLRTSPCAQAFMACSGLTDVDGDGVFTQNDCDDNDPTIGTGLPELCDGIDNNCDGQVDEGLTDGNTCQHPDPCVTLAQYQSCMCVAVITSPDTDGDGACDAVDDCDNDPAIIEAPLWFFDNDEDGFGGAPGIPSCVQPLPEMIQQGGDCDDSNPNVHPNMIEVCNYIDDNCDGDVDEGFFAQYVDNDGDGFGDPLQPLPCDTPGVANADDCDDTDPNIHLGAAEICDGLDNDCDGLMDEGCGVTLSVRVFLEGPYNTATGMMGDGLRALGLVPTTEPFTGMGYAHVGGGGGEATTAPVLAVSGNDAIVDWVILELRDEADPSIVVASGSALVQRDGDVVDTDGVSAVTFTASPGNYFVAVRHGNHLGCMTSTQLSLSATSTTVDLTLSATQTFGTNAQKTMTGTFTAKALWAGDANFDGTIRYTGQDNDRDPILSAIGGTAPTNTITGYRLEDVNMDGSVKYSGQDNDRDPILQNVGGAVPTNTRDEQVP